MSPMTQALGKKMNHPDRCYQEQYERVQMLLRIIESEDISKSCPAISYYELAILCFQAIWNLKDWVLNDPHFEAKDIKSLKSEIHNSELLSISADIANGTKHSGQKAKRGKGTPSRLPRRCRGFGRET